MSAPDSPTGVFEWAIGILMAILAAWNGSQQMQINSVRERQDDLRDAVRKEFREDLAALRGELAELRGDLADRHKDNTERLDRMTDLLLSQRRQ